MCRGDGGLCWLYGASRLFVNFFQPSFKLAAKQRDGAKVTKRYHPPQTPCERVLQEEAIPMAAKSKLREIAADLDPLKLLEEMRAVQAYLAALADDETPPPTTSEPPDLAAFVASLSSAWHAGEIRQTFSIEAKPRYLRSLQKVSTQTLIASPSPVLKPVIPPTPAARMQEKPKLQRLELLAEMMIAEPTQKAAAAQETAFADPRLQAPHPAQIVRKGAQKRSIWIMFYNGNGSNESLRSHSSCVSQRRHCSNA